MYPVATMSSLYIIKERNLNKIYIYNDIEFQILTLCNSGFASPQKFARPMLVLFTLGYKNLQKLISFHDTVLTQSVNKICHLVQLLLGRRSDTRTHTDTSVYMAPR